MAGKPWTKSEEDFIKENYLQMSCREMSEHLDRTQRAVEHKFNLFGLVRPLPKVGDRFGKLVILELFSVHKHNQNITFTKCQCDCGKITNKIKATELNCGERDDCGCEHRKNCSEAMKKQNYKHGKSINNRLFRIWCGMRNRCINTNDRYYRNYGSRGIKVCNEWLTDFEIFEKWALENGYDKDLSIDRINVSGNYEPHNCRWVDIKTQSNNRRTNVYVEAFGERKTLKEWTEDSRCKVKMPTIKYRITHGWDEEESITTPTTEILPSTKEERIIRIWKGMRNRCYNKNSINYERYGAKGVIICQEWLNVIKFIEWSLQNGYDNCLSIDRIDNNKGYSPDNCRWVQQKEQSRNTSQNVWIEAFGEKKILSDWEKDSRARAKAWTIHNRIKSKWDAEKAIITPPLKSRSKGQPQ